MTYTTLFADDGSGEPLHAIYDSEESALNDLVSTYAPGEGFTRETIIDHLTTTGSLVYIATFDEPKVVGPDEEEAAIKRLSEITTRVRKYEPDWTDEHDE